MKKQKDVEMMIEMMMGGVEEIVILKLRYKSIKIYIARQCRNRWPEKLDIDGQISQV